MILWDDATNLGYTEVCIHVKTRNNTISDHATGWRQNVFMLISIQQFFLSPCNTSHVHNRINSIKKANSFQVTLHYDFFDIPVYNKSKKNFTLQHGSLLYIELLSWWLIKPCWWKWRKKFIYTKQKNKSFYKRSFTHVCVNK